MPPPGEGTRSKRGASRLPPAPPPPMLLLATAVAPAVADRGGPASCWCAKRSPRKGSAPPPCGGEREADGAPKSPRRCCCGAPLPLEPPGDSSFIAPTLSDLLCPRKGAGLSGGPASRDGDRQDAFRPPRPPPMPKPSPTTPPWPGGGGSCGGGGGCPRSPKRPTSTGAAARSAHSAIADLFRRGAYLVPLAGPLFFLALRVQGFFRREQSVHGLLPSQALLSRTQ